MIHTINSEQKIKEIYHKFFEGCEVALTFVARSKDKKLYRGSYVSTTDFVSNIDELDFSEIDTSDKWTRCYIYIKTTDIIYVDLDAHVLDKYQAIMDEYGDDLLFEVPSVTGKNLAFRKGAFTKQQFYNKFGHMTIMNYDECDKNDEQQLFYSTRIAINYLYQTFDE